MFIFPIQNLNESKLKQNLFETNIWNTQYLSHKLNFLNIKIK